VIKSINSSTIMIIVILFSVVILGCVPQAKELVLLLVPQDNNMRDLLLLKDSLVHPLEAPLIFLHPIHQLQVKY
jgi:hypothetical protein